MKPNQVPQALYDSKIGFTITCSPGQGFQIKLGTGPAFDAQTSEIGFANACRWLADAAVKHYPDSKFTKIYTHEWQTEDAFKGLIIHIVLESHRLVYNWDLWVAVDTGFEQYRAEFYQSTQFWDATRQAFHDSVFLRLGRLYDPTSGSLSLPNLLTSIHDASEKGSLSSLGIDAVDVQLDEVKADLNAVSMKDPLVKALMQVRNQYFAHRDARLVASGTFDSLPPLNAADLRTLFSRATTLVDKYCVAAKQNRMADHFHGRDDYERAFKLLRKGLNSRGRKPVFDTQALVHTHSKTCNKTCFVCVPVRS